MKYKQQYLAIIFWALFLYLLIKVPLGFLPNIILTLIFGYLATTFTTKLIVKNNKELSNIFFYTLLAIIFLTYGLYKEAILIKPTILLLLGILYFTYQANKSKNETKKKKSK